MDEETWSAVDKYICDSLIQSEPMLEQALEESELAGLPHISVSPNQGKLLQLLVQMHGSRKILEIGTLGGYSAIWLARALPKDGHLITLEANPTHAAVAKANLASAGLADIVEIRIGNAVETLPRLVSEGAGPFDFIFIDADKPSNPVYLDWSLKLSRPGTVIICDNVVRNGEVVDANSADRNIIGVRRYIELLSENPRVSATAIQTVGSKGYDGFSIAIVQG